MSYCNVILRGAVKQTDVLYTYKIPETLEGKVVPGCLCSVPFGKGNRLKTALVTEVTAECSTAMKVSIGDSKQTIDLPSDADTTFVVPEGNVLLTFTGNGKVRLTYDGSTRSL